MLKNTMISVFFKYRKKGIFSKTAL